jgi:hypothetical protein
MANEQLFGQRWADVFHEGPEFQRALKEASIRKASRDFELQDAIDEANRSGDTMRASALLQKKMSLNSRPDPLVTGLDAYHKNRVDQFISQTRQRKMDEFPNRPLGPGSPPASTYTDPDFGNYYPWMSYQQPRVPLPAPAPEAPNPRLDPAQMSPEQAAATRQAAGLAKPGMPAVLAQTEQQAMFNKTLELQANENALRSVFKTPEEQTRFTRVWQGISPAEKSYILSQPPERAVGIIRSHPIQFRRPIAGQFGFPTSQPGVPVVSPGNRPAAAIIQGPPGADDSY